MGMLMSTPTMPCSERCMLSSSMNTPTLSPARKKWTIHSRQMELLPAPLPAASVTISPLRKP